MQPDVPSTDRDLIRLHHLAHDLFHLVRGEYDPPEAVTLQLGHPDALADSPQCADPVVRTLVNAQLLGYATSDPAQANPRYVVALGLLADEVISSLLKEHGRTDLDTARRLHDVRGRICDLCGQLAMRAAPGMTDFGSG